MISSAKLHCIRHRSIKGLGQSNASSRSLRSSSIGRVARVNKHGISASIIDTNVNDYMDHGPNYKMVTRNLALELVRVTEAAALRSAMWTGKGDKNAADQAAVDAMRAVLSAISMDGIVVIGEGEKDEAPMLYCGERIGDGMPPLCDIAVDPLDGTRLIAEGRNGAISVIALATQGSMLDPGPCMYMNKLAVGPKIAGRNAVNIEHSVGENLRAVSLCLDKPLDEVTVVMLDRPRHDKLLAECRKLGARVRLISDGDVAAAIAVASPDSGHSGLDIMLGVGGSPEAVIAACALKCMGGEMQTKLHARTDVEAKSAVSFGLDMEKIYHINDLVSSEEVFFAATGVTDGDLLKGVVYFGGGATTHSIVMRNGTGTVRTIEATHKWRKLENIHDENQALMDTSRPLMNAKSITIPMATPEIVDPNK